MKKFFLFFIAAALVCAFAMPAAAMEEKTSEELIESLMEGVGGWRLYGSARMSTWFQDDGTDDDVRWDLQGNSRLGAHVNRGNWGGRFEFAVDDVGGVTTRILIGTYKLGDGTLTIGQSYTPVSQYFYSNQVRGKKKGGWDDEDLLHTGQQYASRDEMIQFQTGAFRIALVEPNTGDDFGLENADVDTVAPAVEMSYNFRAKAFFVDVSAGYQTYDVNNEGIDSYVGAVGFGFNAGPARLRFNVYGAQNGGQYGLFNYLDNDATWNGTGSVVDNDSKGALVVANFRANDMLSFELGAGYTEVERDGTGDEKALEDEALDYYANAVVRLIRNVFIVPEIGFTDIDSADDDEFHVGAKWQINW